MYIHIYRDTYTKYWIRSKSQNNYPRLNKITIKVKSNILC